MVAYSVRVSMLLSLVLLLLAQAMYLPIVLSLTFSVMWLCLFLRRHQLDSSLKRSWTFVLTLIALISIYFSYRSFIGVEAGVAVLSTFLFAKALESKNKRDLLILFNFALFVSASSFLFSQSFSMAMIVLLSLLSCFTGLYRLQTSEFEQQKAVALKQDLAHVAKFLLCAVPFFVLLFLFFPRLPPLWHIPIPDDSSVTGISDSMSPGDIAKLSQSSELAFRVIGDMSQLPAHNTLYWRAMVLDEYDGQRWTSSPFNQREIQPNRMNELGVNPQWQYQYLAADPRVQWITGLEQSIPNTSSYLLGVDGRITPRRMQLKSEPISLRLIQPQELMSIRPDQALRLSQHNTATQQVKDPQAQQLAQRIFKQSHEQPDLYIQNVLQWYKQQGFAYTLSPGVLGQNRVDDFLFSSKQGFCEHYASSFVMLMRYAGIPARVVVGYQGGQIAPDGKSWEVRQLDAHAWSEVWLKGKWHRYDPTAIIAPQRIDNGMQNYMNSDTRIMGDSSSAFSQRSFTIITQLRIWSDYASYQWQSKVVGYNAETQKNWFSRIGLNSSYAGVIALVIGILSISGMYVLWLYWQAHQKVNAWQRAILKFNSKLSPQFKRLPSETFSAWMLRLNQHVDISEQVYFHDVVDLYIKQMYAQKDLVRENALEQFKSLLKRCSAILKKL
jgi:transglutaminase-like putative cysteine protease